MIFRVSSHALDRYREHHPDSTYNSLSHACNVGPEVSKELVWTLTGRRATVRNNDRTDFFKCAPDGRGIFVLVPMKEDDTVMIRTYLRTGIEQTNFLRRSLLNLEPVIIEEALADSGEGILEFLTEDELEAYAVNALKDGVFVKETKSKNRIVAYQEGRSVDTDKDAIFALALWYQKYKIDKMES
jgi:hypothetical protein